MKEKILELLYENARYTVEEMAMMLGAGEEEIAAKIDEMEKDNVIRGYKTLIDWEKVDDRHVTALIEIKVKPQATYGFEEIANKISQFEYVESVYLMSGGYDLCVIVTGQTFQKVAAFVSNYLAPIDGVEATGTHFVLRRYKDMGVELKVNSDDREKISL
ncbi:MAG: Lrp/AsnC family transcriptional regulator [Acutalibacteraceae bacterium]|nr:Lrp/AsnC family transcriptional regulator [Acutalibacteraceae bacterium]